MLDFLGLGTGPETDPYLAKTNEACLGGDLAECFKSRALGSLEEFFSKVSILFSKLLVFFLFYLNKKPHRCSQFFKENEKKIAIKKNLK